ncbi:hypothetical protein [Micromonospora psammae]|uniref:hypothetical protein n=1 Tax=Micromonospora sp. CPCC 205556 TaxID=3122398 RepID=UPI002FF3E244
MDSAGDSIFDQAVEEALGLDEVSGASVRVGLGPEQIKRHLQQLRPRLLQPHGAELAQLAELEQERIFITTAIRNVVDPFWRAVYRRGKVPYDVIDRVLEPLWFVAWGIPADWRRDLHPALAKPLGVLHLLLLVGLFTVPVWLARQNLLPAPAAVVPIAVAGLLGAVLVVGLVVRVLRRQRRQSEPNILDRRAIDARVARIIDDDVDYRDVVSRIEELELRIRRAVLEQQVLPQIRTYLNERASGSAAAGPVDPREFTVISAPGLGEVDDQRFEIATGSMNRLVRLLRQLPGGSVGLSGPRGVGKTTILRALTDEGFAIWDEPLLRIYLSAPVRYVAVDFFTHLALEVCTAIGPPAGPELARPAPSLSETGRSADRRVRRLFTSALAGRLAAYLLVGGTAVATVAALRATLPAAELRIPLSIVAVVAAAVALAVQLVPERVLGALLVVRQLHLHLAVAAAALVAVAHQQWWHVVVELREPVLRWAPTVAGLVLILALVAAGVRRARRTAERRLDAELVDASARTAATVPDSPWAPLYADAEALRNVLVYDQSDSVARAAKVSAGAGAAVKLAAELSQTDSTLLARRAITMPEMVARLRSLIERATARGRVVIAIDELDKIGDKDDARQFINDLKAIFGVYRSYFIVSVSQDAMIDFERRGLTVRTEVDSAFDEVVYALPMSLDETRELLQRRVLGLSEPYIQLCYCLSGGIPRDSIRVMRSIINAGLETTGKAWISAVTERVLREELARYAGATLAGTPGEEEWPADLFAVFARLRTRAVPPDRFATEAVGVADDGSRAEPAADDRVASVRREVRVVLAFHAEVWRIFSTTASSIGSAEVERLAQARRDLALNLSFVLLSITDAPAAPRPRSTPNGPVPAPATGAGTTDPG